MTFLRWHELIIIREKSYFLDEKLEFNKPFFDDANDIVDDVDKLFVEDSNRRLLLLLCR